MKKLLLTIALCIPMALLAQESSKVMYRTVEFIPNWEDPDKMDAALKDHIKNFHSEGPNAAFVWNVTTGPRVGRKIWMMGPLGWADLDNRPSGEAYDKSTDAVMEHVKKITNVEFWTRLDDLSHIVEGAAPSKMIYVRFWEVDRDHGFMVNGLFKQISEALKSLGDDYAWHVWDNEMRQGDRGRHMATTWPMKNWGDMEDDGKFKGAFIKVHGESSWQPFIEGMSLAFKNSYDEVWKIME